MFIASELIPGWLSLAGGIVMLLACSLCAWHAPWRAVQQVPARQHLLLGGICACVVLWLMSVHIVAYLWLHVLGITALVTLIGAAIVTTAVILNAFLTARRAKQADPLSEQLPAP